MAVVPRRFSKFLALSTALTPVWLAIIYSTTRIIRLIVALSPLWGLILFGLYMFIRLVVGVLTFKTIPEAADLLKQDIAEAKADLGKRGILEQTTDTKQCQ